MDENNWKEAVHWYRIASNMSRPEEVLDVIEPKYYTWLPHLQLAVAYNNIGKVKEATIHNEIALSYAPNDPRIQYNKNIFKSHFKDKYIWDNVIKSIYEYSPVQVQEDISKNNLVPERVQFSKTIGWCVPNIIDAGTIRIRTLNIQKKLKELGHRSELCGYDNADQYDVIVVGKSYRDIDLAYIKKWKELGKKIVADLSEDILEYQMTVDILKECDLVISCSEELSKKVSLINKNSICIEDALEAIL